MASVLAQLTFYENQLYSKEGEVLNYLSDLVGSGVTASPDDVPDLGGLALVEASENADTEEESAEQPASIPSSTPSTTNSSNSDDDSVYKLTRQFAGIDYAQATILSPNNTVTAGLDFEAQAILTFRNSSYTA